MILKKIKVLKKKESSMKNNENADAENIEENNENEELSENNNNAENDEVENEK